MNSIVKSVKHIHIQQIAYTPLIFQAIITYEPHPCAFDESDELEAQKNVVNKLINDKWFTKPLSREEDKEQRQELELHEEKYF
jgi:hypothetical protein